MRSTAVPPQRRPSNRHTQQAAGCPLGPLLRPRRSAWVQRSPQSLLSTFPLLIRGCPTRLLNPHACSSHGLSRIKQSRLTQPTSLWMRNLLWAGPPLSPVQVCHIKNSAPLLMVHPKGGCSTLQQYLLSSTGTASFFVWHQRAHVLGGSGSCLSMLLAKAVSHCKSLPLKNECLKSAAMH